MARILIVVAIGPAIVLAQQGAPQTAPIPPSFSAGEAGEGGLSDLSSVRLLVGRSTLLNIGNPIARVSLTNPAIGDALVTSADQLLLNGKTPGTTSMFVWDRGGAISRYEIEVRRDLAGLSQQLALLFPGERVQASSNGKHIVLSGAVSNKDVIDRLVDVAAGYAGSREEVVRLLQVLPGPRSNQVLLRVRFAEVSRSALSELAMSLFTSGLGINNTIGRVTTGQVNSPGFTFEAEKSGNDMGDRVTKASGTNTFGDLLNVFLFSQRYDLGLLIRALQSKGLFESLAEPNVVAESGKEASFLAGGEFPIPIAQGSGANIGVSVVFKEFGVRLRFTPTVIGDRVHLKVAPEVSVVDFGNAVIIGGFRIPALTTRRTETEVELLNGQTFAIAGLMNNSMSTTLRKIPGIGDIPILGKLFQSKAAQRERTELVVLITPEILANDSPGVTATLPRLGEPFMPPLPANRTFDPPPPAFVVPAPAR